jgi:hypothetical protein
MGLEHGTKAEGGEPPERSAQLANGHAKGGGERARVFMVVEYVGDRNSMVIGSSLAWRNRFTG